ncbi:helix-turn-helix domain-containing protein [Novisyntrophococcus fermenticellae]|uniref:helix-turn-helix domain-containing protein n=1 Tax=Novisyntrophococcus fermenticellae TaxID=2068655 RepID=UPI0038CDA8D8
MSGMKKHSNPNHANKTILHNTDMSVEKIADICGYSSEVHLYRQFCQKTGMTPKDYRKTPGNAPLYAFPEDSFNSWNLLLKVIIST